MGLSGEVRAVSMAAQRVQEAKKLGFEECMLPRVCISDNLKTDGIKIVGVSDVREALRYIGC